ncbi:hypothetical protein FH063_002002 [Azospirillum argentinense]|uniref:Uncharacterized protein n=1 Tax=Azospirillum argentinense TaxID=2970906 RepID=A0A5B0KR81_9PROT|nr:hypothetical protein FH063_002002 [Azospirillum argentinense]
MQVIPIFNKSCRRDRRAGARSIVPKGSQRRLGVRTAGRLRPRRARRIGSTSAPRRMPTNFATASDGMSS